MTKGTSPFLSSRETGPSCGCQRETRRINDVACDAFWDLDCPGASNSASSDTKPFFCLTLGTETLFLAKVSVFGLRCMSLNLRRVKRTAAIQFTIGAVHSLPSKPLDEPTSRYGWLEQLHV